MKTGFGPWWDIHWFAMRRIGVGFWRLLWWRLTGRAAWRTYYWNENDLEVRQ